MNILIKQDRPADQMYNKLYYVLDEQWLNLTAHDMRSALVDDRLDKQSPYTTPTSTSPVISNFSFLSESVSVPSIMSS